MSVPSFVAEFMQSQIGTRVARLGFVNAFSGTVIDARIVGRRIQYEIQEDGGNRRQAFADEVAHLKPELITSG